MVDSSHASSQTSLQTRHRVLISAFACEPGRGSEQEVGWRWAWEMARWFDVTVLTQTRNRPGIERKLAQGPTRNHMPRFEYVELPKPLYRLKSRFDVLTWPYYAVWQIAALKAARRLHSIQPFSLAHHVTFVSFRIPVWLRKLGVPVVFGPVGGADTAPFHLLKRGFGPGIWCKEILRNGLTGVSAAIMRIFPPLKHNHGICLAATPAMAEIFAKAGYPHEVFPAVGIDPGPEKIRRASHPLKFLFVGRFHPLKGTHMLLDAFARADVPGASLTLIGSGGEEAKLRSQADRLGISGRLEWIGKLPRKELPSYYKNHDVLVAPSLYESGGLVALEAMAQGMPVIALDVGGHSVSIHEECGVKISPTGRIHETIHGLADAMKFYATNPGRIDEDGARAQRHVADHYEWHHKARHMKRIYDRLIS